jgi:phage terminase large subunit-like protein
VPNYQLYTCAYCDAETWCETRPTNGKFQCRACKVERFFERVLYPPLGYLLQDWQRKILRDLYGTVDPATGLRKYRRSYISVAK